MHKIWYDRIANLVINESFERYLKKYKNEKRWYVYEKV